MCIPYLVVLAIVQLLSQHERQLPIVDATIVQMSAEDLAAGYDEEYLEGCNIYEAFYEPQCKFISRSSSHLSRAGSKFYDPELANDFNLETAWVEGAPGDGIGEYLEYELLLDRSDDANQLYFDEFRVFNGYRKNRSLWLANGRVKSIQIYVNQKPYCILRLNDTQTCQMAKVNPIQIPNRGRLILRFEIVEVYPGAKYRDTAITELLPFGPFAH